MLTEIDPPIYRMQKELLSFYRNLRLKWFFRNESDKRSLLEREFYDKSEWTPPKACLEIENFISRIQENFDRWKPPRRVCDNLSSDERNLLNHIRTDQEFVYMWEDKGPSFSKMTRDQYLRAGELELNKPNYIEVNENSVTEVSEDFLLKDCSIMRKFLRKSCFIF